MKILLIRHAEPDYKANTLTDKGFLEARMLSERLEKTDIADIYTSPLVRAIETAKPFAEAADKNIEVLDWLREFQGKIIDPKGDEKIIPWNLEPRFWCSKKEYYDINSWLSEENMRSYDVGQQIEYVNEKFDELLEQYGYIRDGVVYKCKENIDKTIAIVCHFGLGMVLASHLSGISPVLLWQSMFLPASSVTTFVTEEREKGEVVFKCMQMGDTSHLYSNNEEISKSGLYPEFFGGEGCGPQV